MCHCAYWASHGSKSFRWHWLIIFRYFIFFIQACGGGNPSNSFRYVEDNAGVDTEDSYPYEGEMEDCTFTSSNVGETLSNFGRVTPGDEEAMRAAIREYVSNET